MASKAQGAYFAQFCSLQLIVSDYLNDTRSLSQTACQCCRAAQRLIRVVPETLESRRKMTEGLKDFLNAWKKFYPSCRRIEDDYVKNWAFVAFQLSSHQTESNYWVSCWGSGSYCKLRGCPGSNGPFYQDPNDYWSCRGKTQS